MNRNMLIPGNDTPATALLAQQLVAGHGANVIIDGLDLTLPKGQVTAIVGPNGCGKSTLLNTLGRVLKPIQGHVYLNHHNIHGLSGREVAKQLALLAQESSAPEGMTVTDLVRFGRQPHQSWLSQWSHEDDAAVKQAISAADLCGMENCLLEELSGGQRQRAWIAMTIAQNTDVLLLDEPTSALDLGHQLEVFELLRSLSSQQSKTVVMVVHDLLSACRFSDNLIAMRDGAIIAQGNPATILTPELVHQLYGIHCDIIFDPVNGAPILINMQRAKPSTAAD
ncbi:MAG: ABC transporter ATP-binding protein [Neptuniibacter sp.]